MSSRDCDVLRHIFKYCEQIDETSNEFDNNKKNFMESATFRNAVCLCLLQIGELVTILSDEFKGDNTDIPWREIKLLRNIVAHRYGKVDFDIIWEVLTIDIPNLEKFCKIMIK